MKKRILYISALLAVVVALPAAAQEPESAKEEIQEQTVADGQTAPERDEMDYRRSSLYSIMVSHNAAKYHKEIESVFSSIPIPEKFDNHDLSVKIINTADKKTSTEAVVRQFLTKNNVARRMVGRWFDRDPETGECDMDLISERGLYDATYFDVELAKMSQRGYGMLSDAGEELINNTFVIVNDIRYRDRNQTAQIVGGIFKALGSIAAAYTGNSNYSSIGDNMGDLVSNIKGFGVNVTTYLYRLEWNDEIARDFYTNQYVARGQQDSVRRDAFTASDNYRLTYVGERSVTSGNISMKGVNAYDPVQMIRKVCTRAIDESIVALQRDYDEFKIKTPIFSVEPTITAKVGLKEGVAEKNRYEVLERVINNDGKTEYRRVGVIEPVKGQIWDNRYMALEEEAIGAELNATTFKKVSGGDFYPGMLIREIKVQ